MREKPCKNLREKRQKIFSGALPSRREREREREKFEKVLKKCLNQSKYYLKKNLNHDVRLIEKQVRSIKPSRGSLNF